MTSSRGSAPVAVDYLPKPFQPKEVSPASARTSRNRALCGARKNCRQQLSVFTPEKTNALGMAAHDRATLSALNSWPHGIPARRRRRRTQRRTKSRLFERPQRPASPCWACSRAARCRRARAGEIKLTSVRGSRRVDCKIRRLTTWRPRRKRTRGEVSRPAARCRTVDRLGKIAPGLDNLLSQRESN